MSINRIIFQPIIVYSYYNTLLENKRNELLISPTTRINLKKHYVEQKETQKIFVFYISCKQSVMEVRKCFFFVTEAKGLTSEGQ